MMIKARQIPLAHFDATYVGLYEKRHGRIPPEQVPQMAALTSEGIKLIGYEFTRNQKPVGYAIVKLRRLILADLYFGPIVLDNEDYLKCTAALKLALRRRGMLFLRIFPPHGAPRPDGYPARFNWATSIIDISQSEEDLLKSFSPNHRQSIRKGIAANVEIGDLKEACMQDYARGYTSMFARRGIRKEPSEIMRFLEAIDSLHKEYPERVFILSARHHSVDHIIGGGVFLCNGDTCTFYQGYGERSKQSLTVLHLVLWEAMKRAKALGCTRFDLHGHSLIAEDRQLKAINDFKRWFRGAILLFPPTVIIPLYRLLHLAGALVTRRFCLPMLLVLFTGD